MTILRIRGPFLFGTTEKLAQEAREIETFAPVVILRLRHMTAIDATGLHAIETFAHRVKQAGKILLLCGARDQPAEFLEQAEFIEHIGSGNILPSIQGALERAREIAEAFDGVGREVAYDYAVHAPI